MKNTNDWVTINSKADLPKESGKYIVFSSHKNWLTFMSYSAKYKTFNVSDTNDLSETKRLGIDCITHWMSCSSIPKEKWIKPTNTMPLLNKEILFKTQDNLIHRGILYNDIQNNDLWITFVGEFKTSEVKCWAEFPEHPKDFQQIERRR